MSFGKTSKMIRSSFSFSTACLKALSSSVVNRVVPCSTFSSIRTDQNICHRSIARQGSIVHRGSMFAGSLPIRSTKRNFSLDSFRRTLRHILYGESANATTLKNSSKISATRSTDITDLIIQNIDQPDIVVELLRSDGYVRPYSRIVELVIRSKNFELLDIVLNCDKENVFVEPLIYIGLCDIDEESDRLLESRAKCIAKHPISIKDKDSIISTAETIFYADRTMVDRSGYTKTRE